MRPRRKNCPVWKPKYLRQHRLAGVDVLRGLCILSVVLHHIHLRFTTQQASSLSRQRGTSGDAEPGSVLVRPLRRHCVLRDFRVFITGLWIRRWDGLGSIPVAALLSHANGSHPSLPAPRSGGAQRIALYGRSWRRDASGPSEFGTKPVSALTFHMNWLEGTWSWSAPAWGLLVAVC